MISEGIEFNLFAYIYFTLEAEFWHDFEPINDR